MDVLTWVRLVRAWAQTLGVWRRVSVLQLCAGVRADLRRLLNLVSAADWTQRSLVQELQGIPNLRPFLPPASQSTQMGFPFYEAGQKNKVPCEAFLHFLAEWQRFSLTLMQGLVKIKKKLKKRKGAAFGTRTTERLPNHSCCFNARKVCGVKIGLPFSVIQYKLIFTGDFLLKCLTATVSL